MHMAHSLPQTLPPLDGLQTALVVARTGSISAAAVALNVTHGAVSRRISALEQWLGVALFERHARGVRPTPDGQRFLGIAGDALTTIGDAAERWRGQRGSNVVRIGVTPSFAKLLLLDRVAAIERAEPAIRLEIAAEHRNADLEAGEADIAIRYGRGTWRGLVAAPLTDETLHPVATAMLVKRIDRAEGARGLLRHPLLHDSDGSGWKAWFAAHDVRFRVRPTDRRFEDYTIVLAAAEAGLGIALARPPITDRYLKRSRLVPLSDSAVPGPRRFYLLTRPNEQRPAVLDALKRIRAAMPFS